LIKKYKTNIYLDDDTKQKLDYLCKIEGRKINNIVNYLINKYYDEKISKEKDVKNILSGLHTVKGLKTNTILTKGDIHNERI